MQKKILVVNDGFGGSISYHRPFRRFGEATRRSELLFTEPDTIALVLFTGGSDIHPSLYGQESSRLTSCIPRRDIYETMVFEKAKQLGKPMVGVCRGAQLLCIMAGGKLVQHIHGHDRWHDCQTAFDQKFMISSTHHQMMLPPYGSRPLAWALPRLSRVYIGANEKHILPFPEREYEVVHFPNINAIGMQYHPEIMSEGSEGFHFAGDIVEKYLLPADEEYKETEAVYCLDEDEGEID